MVQNPFVPQGKKGSQAEFFVETVVAEADVVFRLAYAFSLNQEQAWKVTQDVFDELLKEIPQMMAKNTDQIRSYILAKAWDRISTEKVGPDQPKTNLDKLMMDLTDQCRIVLLFVDAFGLTIDETAEILHCDGVSIEKKLAEARLKMIDYGK